MQEQEEKGAARKPLNILFLYADDWRHDTLGVARTQPVKTPFLDKFSRDGIRFTHNCVTTSMCWISRASQLTGQFLSRHLTKRLAEPTFYARFNQTWPYLLRQAGYWTGHVGQWQFANYEFAKKQYDFTHLMEGYHWWSNPSWTPTNGQASHIHTTDLTQNLALKFLKNRPKDQPFALTVAFSAPKAIGSGPDQWFPKNETLRLYDDVTIPPPSMDMHSSYAKLPSFFQKTEASNGGRTRWVERFGTEQQYRKSMKNYYAMITEVDTACKNIVEELRRQGIMEETLVVFTTDNGFFHGEHGLSGKWFPYQESIRVPLIIRDPRMPPEKVGTLEDSFTLNIDLAPTLLGAANIDAPAEMQGKNIADLYLNAEGQSVWRKEFFYEHPTHLGIEHLPSSTALVRKNFKFIAYPDWNAEQLFDLKSDPLESNDLRDHSDYAEMLDGMRKRHDELKGQIL